jgi:DNA-binding transcriptional regulator YhcF (GntR family)
MFIAWDSANVQAMQRPADSSLDDPSHGKPFPDESSPTSAGKADAGFDGIAVDRNADVPIGVQLAWALRTRIGDGDFVPGQRLPGMRDLAEAIGVNLNTVRAVYQRLEQEGLIESQQGSGTFVAPSGPQGSAAGTIAATAARTARETGVDLRDVAAALYVAPETPAASPAQTSEQSALGQRRRLREQIAAFESALGQIEAANPGVAPPAGRMGPGTGPALLGTEELERVRTMLVRRLAIVQTAIDELAEADLAQEQAGREREAEAEPGAAAAKQPAAKPTRRPRTSARALPAST